MALPTLDQLRVLTEVVDGGSFSAASRRLRRTQSVVSYTIAALEAQLGVRLFARGNRRPVLTQAGHAVLADARRVAFAVDELAARAAGLERGLEAELALAVDVLFPTARLVALLHAFAKTFPTVALRLRVDGLGAVAHLVLERDCTLGISGWMADRFDALERTAAGSVDLIAVAAPGHTLAADGGKVTPSRLRDHVQLVLTDRSRLTEGQDFGVVSPRTWRLGDLGAKHVLLRAGLGWGHMPAPAVAEDIAAGRLVRLTWSEPDRQPYPLVLIRRVDTSIGPAGQWLAGEIANPQRWAPDSCQAGEPAPRLAATRSRRAGNGNEGRRGDSRDHEA